MPGCSAALPVADAGSGQISFGDSGGGGADVPGADLFGAVSLAFILLPLAFNLSFLTFAVLFRCFYVAFS